MLYGVCNAYLSGHGSIVQALRRAYATASQGEVVKVGVRVCGTVYARVVTAVSVLEDCSLKLHACHHAIMLMIL